MQLARQLNGGLALQFVQLHTHAQQGGAVACVAHVYQADIGGLQCIGQHTNADALGTQLGQRIQPGLGGHKIRRDHIQRNAGLANGAGQLCADQALLAGLAQHLGRVVADQVGRGPEDGLIVGL